jgi:hypothetical protein
MMELSEIEIGLVGGGMNLEGYRLSENVDRQYWTQEGNIWVLYSYSGQCLATSLTKPT